MDKFLFCITLTIAASTCSAQSFETSSNNAWMISRMAEKFHVQPRPLDIGTSNLIFDKLLTDLDEERIIFTREDIARLAVYRDKLADEIMGKRSDFLQLLTGVFQSRLLQADSMIDAAGQKPFVFTTHEIYTAAEDSSYPANAAAKYGKIYKLVKLYVVTRIAAGAENMPGDPPKKYIDSLEPVLRKKAVAAFRRGVQREIQSPGGIPVLVGTAWCQALASAYDPHTDYFPPAEKDAFETEVGKKPLIFGFSLKEDDAGNVVIARLVPGSPAFRSGGINVGDRIMAIKWGDKDPLDVSNADQEELNEILATPQEAGNAATITILKTDGTRRDVLLYKERLEVDDENKVQGFILKGAHAVGYISLPAFYQDWENTKGIHGCANDVASEILRLKKEKIEALIIDLRYNGGGSMNEAVELSGLFIDAGPVGQIKDKDGKTITLKDVNRGTIYDGPLILLVNGYSASASEMVAGTLQDYNRALIVGSPTYGKATAQLVMPLDTTIDLDADAFHSKATDFVKMTISRLYRVSGATAQIGGVRPDIALPDPAGSTFKREADEKNPLVVSPIEANKYYHPYPALPLDAARAAAAKAADSLSFFKTAYAYRLRPHKEEEDMPLAMSEVLQQRRKQAVSDAPAASTTRTAASSAPQASSPNAAATAVPHTAQAELYTVAIPAGELSALQADKEWQQISKESKRLLQLDPYIKVSYQVLVGTMIK